MSNVEMKLTLEACLMSVYFDRHFCTFVSRNMERLLTFSYFLKIRKKQPHIIGLQTNVTIQHIAKLSITMHQHINGSFLEALSLLCLLTIFLQSFLVYCWYCLDEMIFNIVYFLVCKSFSWDMSYFAHKWCCQHKLCVDCVFHAASHIFGLCNFWLIGGAANISYVQIVIFMQQAIFCFVCLCQIQQWCC